MNSRIMIHQPLGGAQGQAADIEIQANEILHHKLTLNGYLVSVRMGESKRLCLSRSLRESRWMRLRRIRIEISFSDLKKLSNTD